jgi:hypothetical protein
MQYKIPQEVDVEDKIIGPFTLKGFAFIIVFTIFTVIFMVIFSSLGLSFFSSLIIGGLLGSPILMAGFIPFHGKPLYTYTESFISYVLRPRQRTWKREVEKKPQKKYPEVQDIQTKKQAGGSFVSNENTYVQPKDDIKKAEGKIEEIALMVDTGGAYGQKNQAPQKDPKDIFSEPTGNMEKNLAQAKKEVENKGEKIEPTVADMASVEPNKNFKYDQPDTSKFKIEDK